MQHQTSRPIRTRRLDSHIWGRRVKLPEADRQWSPTTTVIATAEWANGDIGVTHCMAGAVTHTRIPAQLAARGAYLEER